MFGLKWGFCKPGSEQPVGHARHPIVLCFSGHDPSGGAGIQADIEAVAAQGCAAATVVTCLTVQDTGNVTRLSPVAPELVAEQARVLLADIRVDAFKIGLIGDSAVAEAIAAVVREHPDLPLVMDPILAAGGGAELAGPKLLSCIREKLLPRVTLLTPNSLEARRLSESRPLDRCAELLLAYGCKAVLITGGHEQGGEVRNRLYRRGQTPLTSNWPRLPHSYHGSGCTLASSIAALLARGHPLESAVEQGQAYTWQSLSRGWRAGGGQLLPDRLYACRPGSEK